VSKGDGDGWVDCLCGNKHWGLHGAAGIALIDESSILLQHRAPWVHNGGTWGIPGGARDSHESIIEAALREAHEEIGLEPSHITPIDTFIDDHGNWSYTTVICNIATGYSHILESIIDPQGHNEEVQEMKWVELASLATINLHPSFANSLAQLMPLFINLS
jgi:8-oxo-dGTP diphosphatase